MLRKKEYKYYVVYCCSTTSCYSIGSCQITLEKPIAKIEDTKEVSSFIAKNFCDNANVVILINWKELKN